MKRFEEELRRWGSRPPSLPPEAAALRLRARLRREASAHGRAGGRRWLMPAAAALLALAVIGLRFGLVDRLGLAPGRTSSAGTELARAAVDPAPGPSSAWEASPASQGVVVIPLDEETTLYLSLGAIPLGGVGAENL